MSELTYTSYLAVEKLLELQKPRSTPPEHDEQLFIIIHQVYELWFKLMLHEFEKIRADFLAGELYRAISTWKRCRTVMKTLVGQLDILETMTPLSFASFRERLESASGFQSVQFRELEFLLGYKRESMLRYHEEGSPARARLLERMGELSVYDAFYDLLEAHGISVPEALRARDPNMPNEANEQVQIELVRIYKTRPDLAILLELMTDFDEGFQEWRYRHVKMVERTIGNKHGTGGSLGVAFLRESLFRPVFPDLWAIRSQIG